MIEESGGNNLLSSSSQAQDASTVQDMGELLASVEDMKPLRRGDVVQGIVMRVDADGILVSIGHKAEGIVPAREMRTLIPEDFERLKVGDELVTFVIREATDESAAILSIDRAVGEKAWRVLENVLEQGESVEGKIIGFNRGGAIVEVDMIQGFVPMSQLISVPRELFREQQEPKPETSDEENDSTENQTPPPDPKADEIGKLLQLKVLEVNRGRNRAIFSERQALQEMREAQKARLIEELTEGEVRRGKVTGISTFGAFVDLGGADGLIHISELSWSPVNSTEDVVKVGEELDVYVLRVDAENRKIALSLRRLEPEPWETIHERYGEGDIVDATVTKLTNFGAFARVEGSVEGLIHISELTSRMINHPREVVREGDTVKLKILRIEPERRRLGLSLKQAVEEESEEN
jgi:small subunit ribosomal protein S1